MQTRPRYPSLRSAIAWIATPKAMASHAAPCVE